MGPKLRGFAALRPYGPVSLLECATTGGAQLWQSGCIVEFGREEGQLLFKKRLLMPTVMMRSPLSS
jgi:hypothetical protein